MFLSEDAMVEAMARTISGLFPAFAQIEREVASRYGIADVVLARADPLAMAARAHLPSTYVVRPADARVLSALSNVPRAADELCSAVSLTRSSVLKSLVDLQECGRIVRGADGIRRTTSDPYRELVAIEAKLEDWGRALCQARRYLAFADFSYVALPADRVHRVQDLQLGVAAVGLIAISPTSAEIVVPAPRSSGIQAWRRTFVAELLADAWTSKTPVAKHRSWAFGSQARGGSPSEAAHRA